MNDRIERIDDCFNSIKKFRFVQDDEKTREDYERIQKKETSEMRQFLFFRRRPNWKTRKSYRMILQVLKERLGPKENSFCHASRSQ